MIDFDALTLGPIMATFGQPITFVSQQGGATSLTGVFNARFAEEVWRGDIATVSTRPQLGCRLADLPRMPVEGDRFVVAGQLYLVRLAEADGVGHVTVKLDGPAT